MEKLKVFTSTYNYKGTDRLDITLYGKDPIGSFFAPTDSMLMGYRSGTCSVEEYTTLYERLMDESIKNNPEIWSAILHQQRVTLVCFCDSHDFCHRFLLARRLENMGSEYGGEIDANK
jgi:hypothetical protein